MKQYLNIIQTVVIGFIFGVFITSQYKSNSSTHLDLSDPKTLENDQPIRVGILIMATGKYAALTKHLVDSSRRFLLAEPSWMKEHYQVTYFIFTDRGGEAAQGSDVQIIYQRRLGWPSDTLWRCQVYLNATEEILKVDYVFSLDADMLIVDKVGPEVLGDLVGTLHPGFHDKMPVKFTFERNPTSKAHVPFDKGNRYYAGGVFGGKVEQVLEMCGVMDRGITEDYAKRFIAFWHDESHLNHYFTMVKPPTLILSPSYCQPQEYGNRFFKPRIMALLKRHNEMRKME